MPKKGLKKVFEKLYCLTPKNLIQSYFSIDFPPKSGWKLEFFAKNKAAFDLWKTRLYEKEKRDSLPPFYLLKMPQEIETNGLQFYLGLL